jgi:polysaccharide pyruvyl transferase WcaK-like protein
VTEREARSAHHLVLFGYLGGRNAGDDAMLDGLLAALPHGATATVLARDPRAVGDVDERVQVVPAAARTALREIRRATALVRVGGTSFHDEHVPRHRRGMTSKYHRQVALVAAARLMHRPVVALGVGAGAVDRPSTRRAAAAAMRSCDVVVVRDPLSYGRLRGVVADEALVLGADLASLRPGPSQTRSSSGVLGASIVDLDRYSEATAPVADRWSHLVETAAAARGVRTVTLYALKDNAKESDVALAEEVARRVRCAGLDVGVWTYDDGLERVARSIAGCEHFIACRYHSAIMAAPYVRELIVVPYNSKLVAFADDARLPSDALLDAAAEGPPPRPSDHTTVLDGWRDRIRPRLDAMVGVLNAVCGAGEGG